LIEQKINIFKFAPLKEKQERTEDKLEIFAPKKLCTSSTRIENGSVFVVVGF